MRELQEYYRIGVDVGGTNTDAVLIKLANEDGAVAHSIKPQILSYAKASTSNDVTTGICEALSSLLARVQVPRGNILSVNIGTTHFINAIIQADAAKISRVAVLRLCGPFCRSIEPFADFPPNLRAVVQGYHASLNGGLEIDGRIITEIDEEEVVTHAEAIKSAGITKVVVSGVFSPLDTAEVTQERRVQQLVLQHHPDCDIVCSRDIGSIGFLERENASILNASILDLSRETISAFQTAIAELGLRCQLYLTQNDGTVMSAKAAMESPIKTFSSGATNSLIGGIFLAGIQHPDSDIDLSTSQVILVDIGGTTSEFAALSPSGLPREASSIVKICGVRTAFRMPEVYTLGLGGGSCVQESDGKTTVGPTSVGLRLSQASRCFGGDVLTATDVAVARGQADSIQAQWRDPPAPEIVDQASQTIQRMLQRGVESMKTSDKEVVLILVGGGSIIQMDSLEGIARCIRPPFYDVANAIGAAMAKISGEVDTIQVPGERTHDQIQAALSREAESIAVRNGANSETVRTVDVEMIPLQYVKNDAIRVVIKAVGDLGIQPPSQQQVEAGSDNSNGSLRSTGFRHDIGGRPEQTPKVTSPHEAPHATLEVDYLSYIPDVSETEKTWYLSEIDLTFIADGCGILGTGGGGSTYYSFAHAVDVLRSCPARSMCVKDVSGVTPNDQLGMLAYVGAPGVFNERLVGGTELSDATRALAQYVGVPAFQGLLPAEIGGGNGLVPLVVAGQLGIPVIDADTMGRAYPRLNLGLPWVYHQAKPFPAVLADARKNIQVVASADSPQRLEDIARAVCIEFGNAVGFVHSLPGMAVTGYCCHNTISQAWFIGRALHVARQRKENVITAVVASIPGAILLYCGKVKRVANRIRRGWSFGSVALQPDQDDDDELEPAYGGGSMLLEFQNEFLHAAIRSDSSAEAETVCLTPDMITVLDQSTGAAVATNELRFGLRVAVIACPSHELWRGPDGLKAASPSAFGFDIEYQPLQTVSQWKKPISVFEAFGRGMDKNGGG